MSSNFLPSVSPVCQVFCWRSCSGLVRQCRWAYGRQVFMSDIALSKTGMMFVTQEGEGFSGMWAGEYRKYGEKKGEHGLMNHEVGLFFFFVSFIIFQ